LIPAFSAFGALRILLQFCRTERKLRFMREGTRTCVSVASLYGAKECRSLVGSEASQMGTATLLLGSPASCIHSACAGCDNIGRGLSFHAGRCLGRITASSCAFGLESMLFPLKIFVKEIRLLSL
jgi:hypothetical protein